jgi:hypothetical protein
LAKAELGWMFNDKIFFDWLKPNWDRCLMTRYF